MRESAVETYFKDRVQALGGIHRKVSWVGKRGAPDQVAMGIPKHPLGPTIWVELKCPGGVPEDHQLREHKRLRAAGQVVLVIDTIELVDKFFPQTGVFT